MSRYKIIFSLSVLVALILSACKPVQPVETKASTSEAAATSSTSEPIFVIGAADNSWEEFSTACRDQTQEFICHIGVDCTVGDIPSSLYRETPNPEFCDEVPQLTIVFQLNKDYNELVLQLNRGGTETTSVSVDGGKPLSVTSKMLGSGEGWVVGSYDLPLGPLPSGSHSIAFAVADDGEGDGEFAWDALSLTAR